MQLDLVLMEAVLFSTFQEKAEVASYSATRRRRGGNNRREKRELSE